MKEAIFFFRRRVFYVFGALTLFLLLLISSCEKDFNINTGNIGNELVINSLWNDGSPLQVYVTKPYPVGATSQFITAIPDARLELYEDSMFKEVLHYVPSDTQASFGAYYSSLIPLQGHNYTIRASEPKYLSANAGDEVPLQAPLITTALEQYADSGRNPLAKMYMVFRDNPMAQNYYRINAWAYVTYRNINQLGDTSYSYNTFAITPYPLSVVNDTVRDGDFLLFSDRGFNGQEKYLELSFAPLIRTDYFHLSIVIELHTVSYAHYEYFKTLNLYRTSNSDEPVYIFSNVNNGLGAFVAEHIQPVPFIIK